MNAREGSRGTPLTIAESRFFNNVARKKVGSVRSPHFMLPDNATVLEVNAQVIDPDTRDQAIAVVFRPREPLQRSFAQREIYPYFLLGMSYTYQSLQKLTTFMQSGNAVREGDNAPLRPLEDETSTLIEHALRSDALPVTDEIFSKYTALLGSLNRTDKIIYTSPIRSHRGLTRKEIRERNKKRRE